MSLTHWKHTRKELTLSEETQGLHVLKTLAADLQCVMTVWDLEATTFMGRPTFGLTEIGLLHVTPQGRVYTAGSLINPENPISRDAQRVTGITPSMCADKHNWARGWGEAMSFMARNHLMLGFNSTTFDGPAIRHQHSRYGLPELQLSFHWDVRRMHMQAHKTQKGNLKEVANQCGIDTTSFRGHRALADVMLTAEVFCALWTQHPSLRSAYLKNTPRVKR